MKNTIFAGSKGAKITEEMISSYKNCDLTDVEIIFSNKIYDELKDTRVKGMECKQRVLSRRK